jgi:DNA-binding transcriptional LysR family regulator
MLDDLELFLLVASHGSITRAARLSNLPKSTVSRRIDALEKAIGAALFVRGTNGLTLTAPGATLQAECEEPLGVLRNAIAGIRHESAVVAGTVRVALPRTFATFVCTPVLRAFAERHPEVVLELELDDAFTEQRAAGWDASIRIGPLPTSGDLRARLLGNISGVVFASPAYVAAHGHPEPETLERHRAVIFRSPAFGPQWEMLDPTGQARTFSMTVALGTNDLAMVREAALLGIGVARAPRYVVAADLREGRLVDVLPGWTTAPRKVHALFAGNGTVPTRVRLFLDHVALALRGFDFDSLGRQDERVES